MNAKARREAINLMIMLTSAVLTALVVVAGLVFYYRASGSYLLQRVLVSPEVLEKATFGESPNKKFILNKVEFVYSEPNGKKWGRYAVTPDSYKTFYRLVAKDKSMQRLSNEMTQKFEHMLPTTLSIYAKIIGTEGTTIFQQVQFLEHSDLFRVQLYQEQKENSPHDWVYFQHPKIFEKIKKLFAPTLDAR